jgi:hypothetical protein
MDDGMVGIAPLCISEAEPMAVDPATKGGGGSVSSAAAAAAPPGLLSASVECPPSFRCPITREVGCPPPPFLACTTIA